MAPVLHTPLESFLLLQTLHLDDKGPSSPRFERASRSLQSNTLLLDNGQNDFERLNSNSLKDLYIALLEEQAKLEREKSSVSPPASDGNPRKRKLSSPSLRTLEEASRYTYLLPHLLDRLYLQYRDQAIRSIEDEERQYRSLQREIQALEQHTSDARAARPGSQGVPPISALLRETEDVAPPQRPPALPPSAETFANGSHRNEAHVPFHEARNLHTEIYKPLQSGHAENGAPLLPPPAPHPQQYPLPPPTMDRRMSTQNHAPSQSPRLNQPSLPSSDRQSASPIILPPPKGMNMHRASPSADNGVKQYRPPTMPSPQQAQYPPPRQQPDQHPSNRHPPQPYPSYYDNRGYPYPSYGQNPVSIYHPHSGHMQPYHAPASHAPPYATSPYQSPAPPQHSTYYPTPTQYSHMPPYAPPHQPYADVRTPVNQSSAAQSFSKPSPISISKSSTKWKNTDPSKLPHPPKSPVRPSSRDVSPLSDPGSDAEPDAEPDQVTSPRTGEEATSPARPSTGEHVTSTRGGRGSRTRGRRSRGTGARGRGGRAGSAGSSTVAESSRRSHSVVDSPSVTGNIKPEPSGASAQDDSASVVSVEETSRKSTRRRRETLRSLDADPPRINSKRKRDEDLTSIPKGKARESRASNSPPATPRRQPTRKPGHILATRHFARTTFPLMNEITSHRLASLFAKPLTERDAPGYKDLIRRPQDLKSIRAAINAGGRALNAYLEESGDAAGEAREVWVPESEDMMPPKGIVNAAQFDKELSRIFANAVMYNPDVAENRGLGPAFRTRSARQRLAREGGAAEPDNETEEGGDDTDTANKSLEIGVAAPMEGDVVEETREVARDVQESFTAWRAVEKASNDEAAAAGDISPAQSEEGDGPDDEEEEGVKESVEEEQGAADGEAERRPKRPRRK